MSKVAIVTMVQTGDLPHAYCALASAARARRPGDIHLVLLNDQANADLAVELAAASGAEVIQAGENLGVAGGRNRLIREAATRGAEFVLSVDDDILLPPDFIDALTGAYERLLRAGRRPGVLTPATLDFHAVDTAIFGEAALAGISAGAAVETPSTDELRKRLAARPRRRARDIYHMGVADWRGAYLYSGAEQDRDIQSRYGIEKEKLSGAESHLRHSRNAWTWILDGADPQPIDSAPGGICFYAVSLAQALGFHDEDFNPFGFEDADFSLRARKLGFQHFCAPTAIAIHDIAARLSERPVAALRATQGKMAGAFARKHLGGHESAAALAAISCRTIDTVTSREFARREQQDALKTPGRIAGLASFFANAALYSLPAAGAGTQKLIDRVAKSVAALLPASLSPQRTETDDGCEFRTIGGVEVKLTSGPETSVDVVHLSASGLSIPLTLAPILLAAAAGNRDLGFEIEFSLRSEGEGAVRLENLTLAAPGAFRINLSAFLSRGAAPLGGVQPLKVTDASLLYVDEGALARVLCTLAETERLPPAEYLRMLASGENSSAADRFLAGDIDRIEISFSAELDGAPGAIAFSPSFGEVEGAAPNPSVAALHLEHEAAAVTEEAEPEAVDRGESRMTVSSLLDRIVAEDPSVAPFPEAYNPSKALRLARRLRYYSAARGVPLTPNEAKLVSFRNRCKGERAFIIGNGPSLNLVDLTKLKNETTFGVNAIYLNREKMGFLPTHHIVEDVFVAEDRADEINALRGPHKWYGHYLRYCLKPTPEVCWLNVACDYRNYPGFPHFSTNAARIVWVGGTVSYIALQLAYHMGFDEVYLVGFDHSYSIPKEAKVEGRAITSTSDDPNHFHPGYFGKGYRWHDPRVDRMERAYINARAAYESAGRRIYNATVGGHLEVFDRVAFDSLFA